MAFCQTSLLTLSKFKQINSHIFLLKTFRFLMISGERGGGGGRRVDVN